jgi:hypothetical protein
LVFCTADGGTHWEGSDDWVRAQFATYLEAFFASLLTVNKIFSTEREEVDLCTPLCQCK